MTKYSTWLSYFSANAWTLESLPCPPNPTLSPSERLALAPSLAQFQLGEGSDGHGLLRRTQQFAESHRLPYLPQAMLLFIREEQRHSAALGQFMDREAIPRLSHHWIDHAFRRIRNLAGFELMIAVLVTAECIAVPYYRAVHDASHSPSLRAICRRILRDEDQHLEFQADNLAACAAGRSAFLRFLFLLAHLTFLSATSLLVYFTNRPVFLAARMSPLRLWALSVYAWRPILDRLSLPTPIPAATEPETEFIY